MPIVISPRRSPAITSRAAGVETVDSSVSVGSRSSVGVGDTVSAGAEFVDKAGCGVAVCGGGSTTSASDPPQADMTIAVAPSKQASR